MPSVLDRVIDLEPQRSHEPPSARRDSLRQLKQAVVRDLEWLLNTRRCIEDVPPELHEVTHSMFTYGLPDLSSADLRSEEDRQRIRRVLEANIKMFEPRLASVVVTPGPLRDTDHALRFRIDALLKVEPAPEPITFDTMLQVHNGQYLVRES